jgi:hypothetical protein
MPKRPRIELLTVEIASVRVDVREVVRNTYVAAARLRDTGAAAADAAHSFFLNAPPDELYAAAARLRAAAGHAVSLAGELMAGAGRLEQVASLFEASGQGETEV